MSVIHNRLLCLVFIQFIAASAMAVFINTTSPLLMIAGDIIGVLLATMTAAISLCRREQINGTLLSLSRFCTILLFASELALQGVIGNSLTDFNPTFAMIAGLANAFVTIAFSMNIFYAETYKSKKKR